MATVFAFLGQDERRRKFFPKVSVIVRSWNDGRVVERCINTLLAQDYPRNKYQIIIADDGSNDGTREICQKYARQKKIIYARFPKHIELKAKIVDSVIKKYARGEIILETDVDCMPPKNWISEMVKPFADEKVGGVTGTVMTGNWYENFLTRIRAIEDFWHFNIALYGRYRLSKTALLYGSSKAYRKSVWKEIGGHPTKTLVEDAEISIKIIEAGYKNVVIKSCPVLAEEVNNMEQYFSERRRWAKGDLDVSKKYSDELKKDKLHFALIGANFGWDGILFISEILFFLNKLFALPVLICLLSLWTGFAKLKAKPEFYVYSLPYLVAGPWLQAAAIFSILNTVRKGKKVRWTKVWHYPTKLIKPVG
jgi:cellulose synthase/poly-beta-1,6-N-acetylglucosamine synthase-like glycosyltransferase